MFASFETWHLQSWFIVSVWKRATNTFFKISTLCSIKAGRKKKSYRSEWHKWFNDMILIYLYFNGHNCYLLSSYFSLFFSAHKAAHSDLWDERCCVVHGNDCSERKHCSSSAVDDLFLLIIKVYDLRLSWFDMTWSSLKMTLTVCMCACLCVWERVSGLCFKRVRHSLCTALSDCVI